VKSYYEEFKGLEGSNLTELLNSEFINSCHIGDLDKLKYVLTSPELSLHASLDDNYRSALNIACENGHLEIVKYLLSYSNYKNINANSNVALILASENGHLDIIRYILTTPIIKDKYNNQNDIDLSLQ